MSIIVDEQYRFIIIKVVLYIIVSVVMCYTKEAATKLG